MHLPFTRLHSGLATLAACAAFIALAGACSGESGILVEVTRDPDSTPETIERLRFFVGVGDGGRFLQDAEPLELVDLPADRDLASDPFELLLRDGIGEDASGDRVMVAVVGFVGDEAVGVARLDEAVGFIDGEVVRWTVRLVGDDDLDVTDTGCVAYDGGVIAPVSDRDCDNDAVPDDCDDENPEVGPSRDEVCSNQRDDNCNDMVDEETDDDSDGFTNCGGDCNDGDPAINPGAAEVCDGIDNDCNADCDELFDVDQDSFTVCGSRLEYRDRGEDRPPRIRCQSDPDEDDIDCDDDVAAVNPDADEVCDGIDNDCNDACDDGFDADGDDYTTCGTKLPACSKSRPDCEPDDPDVNPGAAEVCDGRDTNCDGQTFPASEQCYGTAMNGDEEVCLVGTRSCDDVNGGGFDGPCNVENNADPEPIPDALCEAYAECEQAGSLDPLACANRAVSTTRTVDCTVAFDSDGVCPGATVAVASPGGPPCLWAIIGGTEQRHYIAGFGRPDLSARVNQCVSTFSVEGATAQGARNDTFLLFRDDAALDRGEVIRVRMRPEFAQACPELPLTCPISPDVGSGGDGG